jgi:alpha-ketoglutarate-dependent taurine dioxygenase
MDNLRNINPVPEPALETRRYAVRKIEQNAGKLLVTWEDNHLSSFHYIWLRDNCMCTRCGDRSGGHRYLELSEIDEDIEPMEIMMDSASSLQIKWIDDNHISRYPTSWLRNNCYSVKSLAERRFEPVLWDAALSGQFPVWDYSAIKTDDLSRLKMFDVLYRYGFIVLNDVTARESEIENLAGVFGFIRQTHYGRIFELVSRPQKRILAETSHGIKPHHDELFRDPIPGMMVMHCLKASEDGGGASILVDGFSAATALRNQDEAAFNLLSQVPIPHSRHLVDDVDDVALSAAWPVIVLDKFSEIAAVHINERTMAPLDIAENLVQPVYNALRKFLGLLYAEQSAIQFRLESGQAMVFDNHRVLHARTAFNGARHIRQCHVDRDEFFSRYRALHRHLIPDN